MIFIIILCINFLSVYKTEPIDALSFINSINTFQNGVYFCYPQMMKLDTVSHGNINYFTFNWNKLGCDEFTLKNKLGMTELKSFMLSMYISVLAESIFIHKYVIN